MDRVRVQLGWFGASVPEESLATIDEHRARINSAKHEGEYFAAEHDYRNLVQAVSDFWNALAPQEEFTVR